MSFFLAVVGMVCVVEGLPYFCFPNQMKSITKEVPNIPNQKLRIFGIILTLLGLLVIYLSKY